jgi:hypothetical protein
MSTIKAPVDRPVLPPQGKTPDNEDATDKGVMDVYEQPEGRSPGTIDAHWGDKPAPRPLGWEGNYGKSTMDAAHDVRHGVLSRILSGMPQAKEQARAEMKALLDHAAEGEHESHSAALTQEKTSSVHAPIEESLTDRVLSVCGRR